MRVAFFVNADHMYDCATEFLKQPLKLDYQKMYERFITEGDLVAGYYADCSDIKQKAATIIPPFTEKEISELKALLYNFKHLDDKDTSIRYAKPKSEFIGDLIASNGNDRTKWKKYTSSYLLDALYNLMDGWQLRHWEDTKGWLEDGSIDEYDAKVIGGYRGRRCTIDKAYFFMIGNPCAKYLEICKSHISPRTNLPVQSCIVTVKGTPEKEIKKLILMADEHIELSEGFFRKYWAGEYVSNIRLQVEVVK